MSFPEKHVFVCENKREADAPIPSCANAGGSEIRQALKEKVQELGLKKQVRINRAGCLGKCGFGPTLVIYPQGIWYGGFSEADIDEIVQKSIVGNEVIERFDLKKNQQQSAQSTPMRSVG